MQGQRTPWQQPQQQVTCGGSTEDAAHPLSRQRSAGENLGLTGDGNAGASLARSGKPRLGRELPADDHITYTVNERRSGEPPPPQLQAMPITVIKTASPPELRQLITVNSSYICYALNETKLRLLNKHTADKGPLLKDHTAGITDVRWRPN